MLDPAHPGVPVAPGQQVVPTQAGLDGSAITPLNVTSFFADPDRTDTLSLSVTGTLPPGVVFDSATGTFSTPTQLDPAASQGGPNHDGVYTVRVTASDGHGGTVFTDVVFQIGNPAPVANIDVNSVGEHGVLNVATRATGVLGNDHDGGADSDPLVVTGLVNANGSVTLLDPLHPVITLPSGALLTLNADGTYSYDTHGAFNGLALGQNATDTFTYQVSDGQGGFDTATATITVLGENDQPVVVDPAHPGTVVPPGTQVIPEQNGSDGVPITPVTVTQFFHDPDNGDVLTLSINPATPLPPGILFDPVTGTFGGTPGPDASHGGPGGTGTYVVTVVASDGHGGTVSTDITFTFVNTPPVAVNDTGSVQEHGTTTGTVLGNDHDGGLDNDPLTVTGVVRPDGTIAGPGTVVTLPTGAKPKFPW